MPSKSPIGTHLSKSPLGGPRSSRNASHNRQDFGRFSNPNGKSVAQTGKLNEAKILTNKLMGFKLNTNKVTMRNVNGQVVRKESLKGEAEVTGRSSEAKRVSLGRGDVVLSKPTLTRDSIDRFMGTDIEPQDKHQS